MHPSRSLLVAKYAGLGLVLLLTANLGCASQWKLQGGPAECVSMCSKWNLEFVAMVGVGNQDATGNGATACVCHVPQRATPGSLSGGAGASSSLAGPIVAAEAAAAAQAAQQQQLQAQSAASHH